MKTLAERIKFHRGKQELSQDKLAKLSGLGQTDISKLETSTIKETPKIAELARALKVGAYWLATGKGDMNLPSNDAYQPTTKEGELAARLIDEMESTGSRQKALKIVDTFAEPEKNSGTQ